MPISQFIPGKGLTTYFPIFYLRIQFPIILVWNMILPLETLITLGMLPTTGPLGMKKEAWAITQV